MQRRPRFNSQRPESSNVGCWTIWVSFTLLTDATCREPTPTSLPTGHGQNPSFSVVWPNVPPFLTVAHRDPLGKVRSGYDAPIVQDCVNVGSTVISFNARDIGVVVRSSVPNVRKPSRVKKMDLDMNRPPARIANQDRGNKSDARFLE